MIAPEDKLRKCVTCGNIMVAGVINGKILKNCKPCRDKKANRNQDLYKNDALKTSSDDTDINDDNIDNNNDNDNSETKTHHR